MQRSIQIASYYFNPFLCGVPEWGTVTKGFDARLANRPFLVFDFRGGGTLVLRVVRQSARISKTKMSISQPELLVKLFWEH